jgi:hypothetical protein
VHGTVTKFGFINANEMPRRQLETHHFILFLYCFLLQIVSLTVKWLIVTLPGEDFQTNNCFQTNIICFMAKQLTHGKFDVYPELVPYFDPEKSFNLLN